jgi:ferredoxin
MAMVSLEKVEPASAFTADNINHLNQADEKTLLTLIDKHIAYTESERAKAIRADWENARSKFIKVMPNEYKRALKELACQEGGCIIMGKVTGFMEFKRLSEANLPVTDRLKNYKEFVLHLTDEQAKVQGARCMDCGIPFCTSGCPINNIIPDWNDLVYQQDWRAAIDVLHSTNNFPEFTGRICPAPCEAACTLNINDDAVGIKSIEHAIIDKAWENNWVVPQPPSHKSGKKVAIVGSGPAGIAQHSN